MKKIILCVALLTFLLINQANAFWITFGGNFCFGAGKDCIGTEPIQFGLVADANYTTVGGLSMTFNETVMDAEYKKSFSTGSFILEKDIALSEKVCRGLGTPAGTILKKGTYKATKKGDVYSVKFAIILGSKK